jgi:hypothetical protein
MQIDGQTDMVSPICIHCKHIVQRTYNKLNNVIYFQQVQEQIKQNLETGHMTELIRDFLHPGDFYRAVRNIGISFFCGVPDSLLKGNILNKTKYLSTLFHNYVV